MITLAIGAAFFYFAQQNYALFNGIPALPAFRRRSVCGIDWRDPKPFYYLCLLVAAVCYAAVLYCSRSAFGLALQAIRDNPRRMRALGYNVTAHKVVAYSSPASSPGSAACCWSGSTAASRPAPSASAGDRHPGHRRDRRHAPSDRAVYRRGLRHPDPDLRHRHRRRRALQHADRRGVPGDRPRLAGRHSRPMGEAKPSLRQKSLRSRP